MEKELDEMQNYTLTLTYRTDDDSQDLAMVQLYGAEISPSLMEAALAQFKRMFMAAYQAVAAGPKIGPAVNKQRDCIT